MNTLSDPLAATPSVIPAFGAPTTNQVQEAVAAARSAGYAAGWSLGAQQARAQVASELELERARLHIATEAERRQLRQVITALQQAASQVAATQAPVLEELSDLALAGSLELAAAVLRHEVRACADPGRDALRRALALTDGAEQVLVRLHPDDAATLAETELSEGVRVIADASLNRGDSVAELGNGRVEVLLEDALQRARDLLHG